MFSLIKFCWSNSLSEYIFTTEQLLWTLWSTFTTLSKPWNKFFFARKPIFGAEKCPQIHIVPKHIKVSKVELFPMYEIFSRKNGLFVDINEDLWALIGKNYKKIVVYPKMSAIFSKIGRKQRLHACNFFHVWENRRISINIKHMNRRISGIY